MVTDMAHTSSPQISQVSAIEEAISRTSRGEPVWQYFDHRVKSHNEAINVPPAERVPAEDATKAIAHALDKPQEGRRRAIYIHIPFCQEICSFCSFLRRPSNSFDLETYVNSLLRQIHRMGNSRWASAGPIESVFVGGGTPTTLSAEQLAEIVTTIRKVFHLPEDCEITIESRFFEVDRAYLDMLAEAGVNRISFGVQTFDAQIRRHVGRIAGEEEVRTKIRDAAAAGIDIVCIDLIYNLPGQTTDSWKRDIETVLELPISGLSAYALIPFPNSALMNAISRGDEEPLGGRDREYEFFCIVDEMLGDREGWKRFGSRHIGRIDVETSRYNASRGAPMDILALGSGAGGRIGSIGYMGSPQIENYTEDQENGCDDRSFAAIHNPKADSLMRLFTLPENLRLVDPHLIDEVPGLSHIMEGLECLGLIVRDGETWALTQPGRFWSYNIAAMMSEAIRNDLGTESFHHHHHKENT